MNTVIVVGAGLSGLYCCDQLLNLNKSLNIILIESSDRIGGRTLTVDDFDLGGQWVGKSQTEIIKLIKHFGLKLVKQKYSDNFLSKAEVEFIGINIQNDIEFTRYLSNLKHLTLTNVNENKRFAKMSVYDHIRANTTSESTAKLLDLYIESSTAVSSKDLNMLFFLFDTLGSKDKFQADYYIKGGSQQLSERIYHKISKQIDLKLSTQVRKVRHIGNKCIVYTNKGKFISPVVIFCLSPIYLRKINNDFPIYKKDLFTDMVMPVSIKIVLVYSEKFWKKNKQIFDSNILTSGILTNVLEGPGTSLICLITGRNALSLKKMSSTQRYKTILQQIEYLYSYNYKPLMYYEKIWDGCYAGSYKPGKYHNYTKLSEPVKNHYYFACSDVSNEFYGYMEGAIRSVQKVIKEIINDSTIDLHF